MAAERDCWLEANSRAKTWHQGELLCCPVRILQRTHQGDGQERRLRSDLHRLRPADRLHNFARFAWPLYGGGKQTEVVGGGGQNHRRSRRAGCTGGGGG